MKRLSSFLLCIFIFQNIFAQHNQEKAQPPTPFCGHDMVDFLAKNDLEYLKRHNAIEQEVYGFFQKENPVHHDHRSASPPPYTLPVAVHVIHDGGAENISDAQVLQGIQDLNDAFANVGYYDPTTGVNTQIQFCLAKRDPDGNASTGINRVQTPLTDMTLETDDITVKDLSRFDPLHYINIWVVREICSNGFGCGVAGYAYFPASHGGPEDGIMMEAEFFGSSQAYSGVIIHEMGHYLGLYHTFQDGCTNNDCLADGDRVCDTPPDQTTAWIPCGNTSNSCSTDANSGFPSDQNDLFQDYMDYSDLDCYSVFTAGQTERMHWHIENVRASLLDSEGCNDPCTAGLTANFGASQNTLEVGGTVNFTNSSSNTTTAIWEIDGVNFANSTDADYTFNAVGTFEICLQVGNADPNCSDVFCENITVTCPVEAAFSTTVFYPAPGEMVNYTNSSSGASQYEWTVNGNPVSTDTDLTWTFDNEGIFDLCLISSNGLCEAQFCLPVFVADGTLSGGCDTTFLKTYGTFEDDEDSRAIAIVPQALGGGFLLGGGKADSAMITLLDPAGDIIWTRSFDATPFADDFIWDIQFDSDNMVIGVGNTKNEPQGNVECFAFRYDMMTNTMLWINELDMSDPARESYQKILEKTPGGNYVVNGETDNLISGGTGCDAILIELDRNTGANVWQRNMHFGSCETFLNAITADGGIYAVGRYNFDGGGQNRFRPGISKFDLNGNQLWSRWYLEGPAPAVARLYGRDMVEDNGLVVFGYGDDDGTSTVNNELLLYRTDYDGNLEWAMQYDIPGSVNERGIKILNIPDGYLCMGFHDSPDINSFIFKTDKQGNLQWAKNYGSSLGDEKAWDMLWQSGQVYFTGQTDTPTGGVSDDIFLANISADGTTSAQDSCNLFTDLEITQAVWENPYDEQHDLEDLGLNFFQFLGTAIMGETAVQSTVECFTSCLDTCDLVMDAAFSQISATCAGDSIQAILEICNLAEFPITAGMPLTIYDADPTAGSANVVTTIALPSNIAGGECFGLAITISANANQTYFLLLNEDGSSPTPIDLGGLEGVQGECDFGNNLASFSVDFQAPILDLGPDISACENQAVTLDAGPGFIHYEWSDLSEMQTLTAYLPGTYSVTVTDACGGTQSDEITISINPATTFDLGPDQSVCEGGTISFDLAAVFYENFEWTPSTGVTCLNAACSEAEILPTANTTYVVTASTADGCVSSDSVQISVSPGFDTSESIEICEGQSVLIFGMEVGTAGVFSETFTSAGGCDSTHTVTVSILEAYESIADVAICEGDTVLVFGNPVFAEGEFSETFTASNGCDSTVTVSVGFLETFQSFEDAVICEGDTLFVFGQPVTGAGEFSGTFMASNGCDSTHTISVGVLETTFTTEGLFICAGESVDIFGTPTTVGGVYEMTFPGSNGCDSTHAITLTVNPAISLSLSANDATCFGAADGTATVTATGGTGSFVFMWENAAATSNITGLPAGTYTVTATDAEGCTASASIGVAQPTPVEVSASGENISCSELGSASANATGGTGGFTFEWSTGAASPNIDGLEAGIYEVTATDAHSCTATTSVEITGALGPAVAITIDQLPSEDEPDGGALTASTTGGTAPFGFAWSNGGAGVSQTGLASGQYEVTVTDANGCTSTAVAQIYVPACTGGKIWNDTDRDGCQGGGSTGASELGIGGIELELNGTDIWGNAITMTTTSAINGEYIFEPLPPGDFVVTLPLPAGYQYSPENACSDDFTDSDFDMNGMSYTVNLAEGHCCLVVDGGLFDECQNVYAPGEICCDQVLCGPGGNPAAITSVAPAAGANAIEYMWVSSTDGVTWTGIPNTNTAGYDPGPIAETTQFARCVRAVGCSDWLETAPVTIIVDDVAVAAITSPQYLCVGTPASFLAAPNPMGATYTWHFGPTASPSMATGQNPTVVFSSFGYPAITLTVEYDGCTSTSTEQVAVSNSTVYCAGALQSRSDGNGMEHGKARNTGFALYPNPATSFVTLSWGEGIEATVSIELLRADGRTLSTSKVDGMAHFHEVDLSGTVSGIYFLKVKYGEGEMEVFRVVKE